MTVTSARADAVRTDRGTVVAWGLWDWGSAALNAVLITFIFSVYLTDSVGQTIGDSVWKAACCQNFYGK